MTKTIKKNGIWILLSIFLLSAVLVWYFIEDNKVSTFEVEAKQLSFSTVDEMIEFSKLIVVGEPLKSTNHVTYDEEGFTVDAYTITEFRIDRILGNKTAINFSESEIIKVAEPTYIIDNGIKPGKTQFSYNNYQNMLKENQYMLLLVKDVVYDDLYVIAGLSEGKHNISIKGEDVEKANLTEKSKNLSFKNELLKIYDLE